MNYAPPFFPPVTLVVRNQQPIRNQVHNVSSFKVDRLRPDPALPVGGECQDAAGGYASIAQKLGGLHSGRVGSIQLLFSQTAERDLFLSFTLLSVR